MEWIAQLFRTLANRSRIRILRVLAVLEELTVGAIADAVELPQGSVSNHMHALAVSGVAWRRRSAQRVYYRLADAPSNELTMEVIAVLREVFGNVKGSNPKAIAAFDQRELDLCSDAALFLCFTAFTHPRRLQVLRHLTCHGKSALGAMGEALSMSPSACGRHVAKLERRGFVRTDRKERRPTCEMGPAAGFVRQRVLAAVVAAVMKPLS